MRRAATAGAADWAARPPARHAHTPRPKMPATPLSRCACCSDERGDYFAVDLGGTNLRVLYAKLSEKKGEVVRARGGGKGGSEREPAPRPPATKIMPRASAPGAAPARR